MKAFWLFPMIYNPHKNGWNISLKYWKRWFDLYHKIWRISTTKCTSIFDKAPYHGKCVNTKQECPKNVASMATKQMKLVFTQEMFHPTWCKYLRYYSREGLKWYMQRKDVSECWEPEQICSFLWYYVVLSAYRTWIISCIQIRLRSQWSAPTIEYKFNNLVYHGKALTEHYLMVQL